MMAHEDAHRSDAGQRERLLNVAQVRAHATQDTDVMFYESARIYRLPKSHPQYPTLLQRLRDAAASRKPVRVRFDAPNGGVIEYVETDG